MSMMDLDAPESYPSTVTDPVTYFVSVVFVSSRHRHHYQANTLLTKNCRKAMNGASKRHPDLSYERVHGDHKEKNMNVVWYFWLSFLMLPVQCTGCIHRELSFPST
jgi:hypothetical protein